MTEAVEQLSGAPAGVPLVLTCEHASNFLPGPWRWPPSDRWIIETHWSHDIGAAALTRELAATLRAPAVLSRFTRLLIDPNRDLDARELFRSQADGKSIALNTARHSDDERRRISKYYRPYHAAIEKLLVGRHRRWRGLVAIHTFTPVYEKQVRDTEIGVLFDTEEALARKVLHVLKDSYKVALNDPWSGVGGRHAYSPWYHGRAAGLPWIELEVRQDISGDPERRRRLVPKVARALELAFEPPN